MAHGEWKLKWQCEKSEIVRVLILQESYWLIYGLNCYSILGTNDSVVKVSSIVCMQWYELLSLINILIPLIVIYLYLWPLL